MNKGYCLLFLWIFPNKDNFHFLTMHFHFLAVAEQIIFIWKMHGK